MLNFIIRRLLYVPLILFGVMLLTFVLFFVIYPPEVRARAVNDKRATPETIQTWLHNRGYDKPTFFNTRPHESLFDSIFFHEMWHLATFNFGKSDTTGEDLGRKFLGGAIPSLAITLPAFVAGIILAVSLSLYIVLVRHSAFDHVSTIICVIFMSVVPMLYIYLGQIILAIALTWFPVSGYDLSRISGVRFLILPVVTFVFFHLGSDVRIYRTVFLEEIAQDYVRTARAKGVSNERLLFLHVLKNGMIALITLIVAQLPLLVLGSLLVENFFDIPGLGNVLIHAIQTGDAATVSASVFLGSILYQAGLIATDICYALADPRIRLS
jgi:peptide/nickel transport system permease protein